MRDWLDLELDVDGSGQLRRRVADSVAAQSTEGAPAGALRIDDVRRFAAAVATGGEHRALSAALFEGLLGADVGATLAVVRERAAGPVLLRFGSDVEALRAAPWEALADPSLGEVPLALDPRFRMARSFRSGGAPPAPAAPGLPRFRFVGPGFLAGSAELLRTVLEGAVRWLPPVLDGTWSEIEAALAEGAELLHLAGHGGGPPDAPGFTLAAPSADWDGFAPAEQVARALSTGPGAGPRLVHLQSCDGADPGSMASAAERVAQAAVGAVFAWRWHVDARLADRAAVVLYRALATGAEGDVAHAVRAVHLALAEDGVAVAGPTLLLRSRDTVLFDPPRGTGGSALRPAPPRLTVRVALNPRAVGLGVEAAASNGAALPERTISTLDRAALQRLADLGAAPPPAPDPTPGLSPEHAATVASLGREVLDPTLTALQAADGNDVLCLLSLPAGPAPGWPALSLLPWEATPVIGAGDPWWGTSPRWLLARDVPSPLTRVHRRPPPLPLASLSLPADVPPGLTGLDVAGPSTLSGWPALAVGLQEQRPAVLHLVAEAGVEKGRRVLRLPGVEAPIYTSTFASALVEGCLLLVWEASGEALAVAATAARLVEVGPPALLQLPPGRAVREIAWEVLGAELGGRGDVGHAARALRGRLRDAGRTADAAGVRLWLRAGAAALVAHTDEDVSVPGAEGLPTFDQPLRGRSTEQDLLYSALAGDRGPVQVVGPPGVGKSHLAASVLSRLAADTGRELCWVDCAGASDLATLGLRVARALGQTANPELPGWLELLLAGAGRRVLALDGITVPDGLDLEAVSRTFEAASAEAPELTLLLTSRAPLELAGGRVQRLDPLPVPPEEAGPAELRGAPAVALLCDHIRATDAAWTPDEDDLVGLARLARRLDGLPLALVLAARRVRALGLDALSVRLEALGFLPGGGSVEPVLERTIRWSWEELPAPARRALAVATTFRAGFTLDAFEAVHGPGGLDALHELVDRSLVAVEARLEPRRYHLLGVVHAFVAQQGPAHPEAAGWERLHAAFYATLGDDAGRARLRGPGGPAALRERVREGLNLRTALARSREAGELGTAARCFLGLAVLDERRGPFRSSAQLGRELLAADTEGKLDAPLRLHTLRLVAKLDQAGGAGPEVLDEARRAAELAAASAPRLRQAALNTLGGLYLNLGRLAEARPVLEEALLLPDDDPIVAGGCRMAYGTLLARQGDTAGAEGTLLDALERFRLAGDAAMSSVALNNVGYLHVLRGNPTEAMSYLDEAARLAREAEEPLSLATALGSLAEAEEALGRLGDARARLLEALRLERAAGSTRRAASTLRRLGRVAKAAGDGMSARTWLEEAGRLFAALGNTRAEAECLDLRADSLPPERAAEAALLRRRAASLREAPSPP